MKKPCALAIVVVLMAALLAPSIACASTDLTAIINALSDLSDRELLELRVFVNREVRSRNIELDKNELLLADDSEEIYVWISENGKRYHDSASCSNMVNPQKVTLEEAVSRGLTPCTRCKPPKPDQNQTGGTP